MSSPSFSYEESVLSHLEKVQELPAEDDAEDTDAAVTESVAVAAEAATEATQEEDDEEDDEYESNRHGLSPVATPKRCIDSCTASVLIGIFHYFFCMEIPLLQTLILNASGVLPLQARAQIVRPSNSAAVIEMRWRVTEAISRACNR